VNPFVSFLKTFYYITTGRLSFPRHLAGKVVDCGDGREFVVFRQAQVKAGSREEPTAVLIVRFSLKRMSPRLNKLFSLLPIPFFCGLPGFRGKLWTLDEENGLFQGIYQWASAKYAENYARSFAMRFMQRRSVPGSLSYRIEPGVSLTGFLESLKKNS
jgi:hypothetical protein